MRDRTKNSMEDWKFLIVSNVRGSHCISFRILKELKKQDFASLVSFLISHRFDSVFTEEKGPFKSCLHGQRHGEGHLLRFF